MTQRIAPLLSQVQQILQTQAAKGLLTCKDYNTMFTDHVVASIAINVFLGSAAVASAFSLGVVVTSSLATAALALLAYNIYQIVTRYHLKIEAARWEPLFKNILGRDWEAAYQVAAPYYEPVYRSGWSDEQCGRLDELESRFMIKDCRFPQKIYLAWWCMESALLAAAQKIQENPDHPTAVAEGQERINKYASSVAAGWEHITAVTTFLTNYPEEVKTGKGQNLPASRIKSIGSACLLDVIEQVSVANPEGGSWLADGQYALKFLNDLLDFEWDSLVAEERKLIRYLVRSANLQDLKTRILSVNPELKNRIQARAYIETVED